jgi:hypothetical protein
MTKRRDLGKKKAPSSQADKPPLAAILSHYDIEFRDVFGWQTISCIFHDEATPSLRINLEEGGFACKAFACGASGGDSFAFLMQYENCTFPQALELAKEITGQDYKREFKGNAGSTVDRVSEGSGYRPAYGRRVATNSRGRRSL